MNERFQRVMIGHGGLILLAGMLSGLGLLASLLGLAPALIFVLLSVVAAGAIVWRAFSGPARGDA